VNSLTIDAYGNLMPCIAFPVRLGNVREDKIADVWRRAPLLKKIRKCRQRDVPFCRHCRYLTSCSRCPGLAHSMAGDCMMPYPDACALATIRGELSQKEMGGSFSPRKISAAHY
jgi:radical SAM protein with 4Fe4S-binding SPASM domain